jgi:hypothetical protein
MGATFQQKVQQNQGVSRVKIGVEGVAGREETMRSGLCWEYGLYKVGRAFEKGVDDDWSFALIGRR